MSTSFEVLRRALDAAATVCPPGAWSVGSGQTFFAPTDAAWQVLEASAQALKSQPVHRL